MHPILASKVVGISELKSNPAAILNRNKPVGYIISPEVWETLSVHLDDLTLATERLNDGATPVKVSLDEL